MFGSMGGFGLMGFDEDPFASSRRMFSQMDNMMNSMMGGGMPPGMGGMGAGMGDPFGDPFYQSRQRSAQPAIMGPPSHHVGSRAMAHMNPSRAVVSHGHMDPFSNMMSAMENVSRQGSCQSFSSSSVMTMRTGPDGKPQVYQSSSSSQGVPGGVNETRHSVSDSSTGMRKMAIGRHIGDRSYVKEKEINAQGELEENDEYVNLDEEEVPQFESEFRHHTQRPSYGGPSAALEHRHYSSPARQRTTYMPALPSSSARRRPRPLLSLTSSGASRYDESNRHRQKEKGVRKERNQ